MAANCSQHVPVCHRGYASQSTASRRTRHTLSLKLNKVGLGLVPRPAPKGGENPGPPGRTRARAQGDQTATPRCGLACRFIHAGPCMPVHAHSMQYACGMHAWSMHASSCMPVHACRSMRAAADACVRTAYVLQKMPGQFRVKKLWLAKCTCLNTYMDSILIRARERDGGSAHILAFDSSARFGAGVILLYAWAPQLNLRFYIVKSAGA
jgi:hypothetical protein